jgi:hypothetical protein
MNTTVVSAPRRQSVGIVLDGWKGGSGEAAVVDNFGSAVPGIL